MHQLSGGWHVSSWGERRKKREWVSCLWPVVSCCRLQGGHRSSYLLSEASMKELLSQDVFYGRITAFWIKWKQFWAVLLPFISGLLCFWRDTFLQLWLKKRKTDFVGFWCTTKTPRRPSVSWLVCRLYLPDVVYLEMFCIIQNTQI